MSALLPTGAGYSKVGGITPITTNAEPLSEMLRPMTDESLANLLFQNEWLSTAT